MILMIALLDFVAAIAMLSLMKAITSDWGIATPQQRWALFRRLFYAIVALALAAKGSYRLDHLDEVFDWRDEGAQIIILLYVLVFPALRASGLISQDKWV